MIAWVGESQVSSWHASDEHLDLQHHLFLLTFKGKLFTAPIPKDQILHNVLDVGTGTGIWAIDFGTY
jgi:methylase of polypeptide subunit release factors